jgi:hypothetical protein
MSTSPHEPSGPPTWSFDEAIARENRIRRRRWLVRGVVAALIVGIGVLWMAIWIPLRDHLQARAWLNSKGCSVSWGNDPELGIVTSVIYLPEWEKSGRVVTFGDAELAAIAKLYQVDSLVLADCEGVTAQGLTSIGRLRSLRDLDLSRLASITDSRIGRLIAPLDDSCLIPLTGLPKLSSLSLSGNRITDDGLAHLARIGTLQTLDLTGTEVTDAGLEHLRALPRLQSVELGGTRVTAEGAMKLQSDRPGLSVNQALDPDLDEAIKARRGQGD